MNVRINSLVIFAALIFFVSCRKENQNQTVKDEIVSEKTHDTENQLAINMLNEFYHAYISEIASSKDPKNSQSKLDSLKTVYCTPNLIDKVNEDWASGDLDYDPFINAQDADSKMSETVTVNYIENSQNKYEIKFRSKSNDEIKVILAVTNDGGKIKISSLN